MHFAFPPYPACPIPLSFYPLVNIALLWFGAPLAAYLGRRNVLIGLWYWGLLLANGLLHSAGGVFQRAYNTGLWTAAILFVPLSLWVIYACAISGPYSGKVIGVAFAAGAVTHVIASAFVPTYLSVGLAGPDLTPIEWEMSDRTASP